MATIPIEVIVQDADTPVDPTPTPETNNTETNITVPDTGAETLGNNTFSSSSVASIILPIVLLVVSLATICTLLIHRHHKRQDSKVSKKEKLSMSASATIAVLAATVLVGDLILPVTKAATSDTEVSIEVPDKISIVVSREDDITEATTEATAYITSTSAFGYKVLLSMADGVDTANLYLDGDSTSEYYITPAEGEELSANTWGYTLASEDTYNAVPLADGPAIISRGEVSVEDEKSTIFYGVSISKSLPAGVYTGELNYSASALEPIETITYMQDFATLSTEAKTVIINSMVEDQPYYLKDNRDNKTYRISKLEDGKVWMTQNLDLQKENLLASVILNDDNTDRPVAEFALPDSQIDNDTPWGSVTEEESVNTTRVYDLAGDGHEYYNCLESRYGTCQSYDSNPIPSSELGNLYNWYTATAGTGTFYMNESNQASGSICPAGWQLPTGGESGVATNFSTLLYAYGVLESPTSDEIIIDKAAELLFSPVSFMRSGSYWGILSDVGLYGGYWSSVSSSSDHIRAMSLSSNIDSVDPWGEGFKLVGSSVRCLVR